MMAASSLSSSSAAAGSSMAPTSTASSTVGNVDSTMGEFELLSPPTDGISSLSFGPNGHVLLVTSWDKTVRVYDVVVGGAENTSVVRGVFNGHNAAVLDGCFIDATHVATGGLDKSLLLYDINTSQSTNVGVHTSPIKSVSYCDSTRTIVTGSWDKTAKVWDVRAPSACIGTLEQPGKVYSLDVVADRIVVGTAGRHVWIWDVRQLESVSQRRESSLKYQTRTLRCMPNGNGYVMGSVEGRIAVEYFNPSPESQKRKYAFKCHRSMINGVDTIFPVNAIAFHPTHGTFASGGCDGIVNFWDGFNKKRLLQLHKYPSSIAALSFSRDGSLLAIASSYTYEEGPRDHPPDSIFIRPVSDTETRPK